MISRKDALQEVATALKGISEEESVHEDGWWETSYSAIFGAQRLDAVNTLVTSIYDSLGSCEKCQYGGAPQPSDAYYPLVTCVRSEDWGVVAMPVDGFCSEVKVETDGD